MQPKLGSIGGRSLSIDEGYVAASIKIPMLLIYCSLKLVEQSPRLARRAPLAAPR
jgi:hypothetical protein